MLPSMLGNIRSLLDYFDDLYVDHDHLGEIWLSNWIAMRSSSHNALGQPSYSQTSDPTHSVFKMVADRVDFCCLGAGQVSVYRFLY